MAWKIMVGTEDDHEYELQQIFDSYDEADDMVNEILSDTSYIDDSMINSAYILKA